MSTLWLGVILFIAHSTYAQFYNYGDSREGYDLAYGRPVDFTSSASNSYESPSYGLYSGEDYPALQFGQLYRRPSGADRALEVPRDYAAQNLRPEGHFRAGDGTVTDPHGNAFRSFGIFGDNHLRTRGEGGLKK